MVSKDKSSEQIDADILQCRADILRAHDITPPYAKTGGKPPLSSQHTDKNTNRPAAIESPTANPAKVREDVAPIPIEAAEHKTADSPTVNHKPAVTRGELVEPTNQHGNPEIPKFNLAE